MFSSYCYLNKGRLLHVLIRKNRHCASTGVHCLQPGVVRYLQSYTPKI